MKSFETKFGVRIIIAVHNPNIGENTRKRALEKLKATKHQVELVLANFRNVYQAEAKFTLINNLCVAASKNYQKTDVL